MKVALISMDQKWEDKDSNLNQCNAYAESAAKMGAGIVIFPEMTLTGFTMNTDYSAEDSKDSDSIHQLSKIAKNHNVAMIAGVVLRGENKAENVLIAFSNDGIEQTRYSKIHPFSFAGEDNYFQSGNALATFSIKEFTFGLSICYDLRFPELYTALGKDCNVLVNIANWPKMRVHHWETLLRARAIENQTYVIGVNRTGMDGNGLEYSASSMVINANGETIEKEVNEHEISLYTLDIEKLITFKKQFSTTQDRKTDLYRTLI